MKNLMERQASGLRALFVFFSFKPDLVQPYLSFIFLQRATGCWALKQILIITNVVYCLLFVYVCLCSSALKNIAQSNVLYV